jgi:3-oxoacyl-[acyl-carrier protein] reductase
MGSQKVKLLTAFRGNKLNHQIISGLKDKKVLVTGATGGIGNCLIKMFAEKGAILGIHYYRNQKMAKSLSREIEANGGKSECFQADLLSNSTPSLFHDFIESFGGIDVLVNNAGGILDFKEFLELDEFSWNKTHRLNTQAPFFLAQQAFANMKENGGGKIINVSSIAAKYGGSSKSLHYGAAKAALESVTVGLARAGAQYNILVNAVRGGFIDSPLQQRLIKEKDLKERIDLIPLKRAGKPEDIAGAVVYLASEAGDFITGEIMTVSGGD